MVQLPDPDEVGTDCDMVQVTCFPAIASSPHLVVHDGHQVDDANDINMDIAIPPSADLPFVHNEDSVSHQANSLSRIDHIDWSHIDQLADNSDVQVAS